MEELKVLYPLQFGFREKFSTSHALISITESIRPSIDNNELGCGIFLAGLPRARSARGQSPIPIDYGQPLFLWLSRD